MSELVIPIGWWIAPLAVTVVSFGVATAKQDNSPTGDYGRIGQGIGNAMIHGVALIASLVAWLVWAVAT